MRLLIEGGNIWSDVETRFDLLNLEIFCLNYTKIFKSWWVTLQVIGSAYNPLVYDSQGNDWSKLFRCNG